MSQVNTNSEKEIKEMKRYGMIGMLALSLGILMHVEPALLLAEEAAKSAPPAAASAVAETASPIEEAVLSEAGDAEFSYGTVKSVSVDQIVVSEYDYDADKDVEVTYTVTGDTKFENVSSVSEIAAGDSVDVDFMVKDGQKIASAISVEKPVDETEDLALEAQGNQAEAEQPAQTN